MRKKGILGGTFNPIHIGHLILAEQAYREFGLDEVLIMPSGMSYKKSGLKMPDKEMRLKMARIAVSDIPYFTVSDLEVRREGNTYTSDTILELNRTEPDTEFYFICGTDSLKDMKSWKAPEIIFKGAVILAALRAPESYGDISGIIKEYERDFGARILTLQTPSIDISSSMIREFASQKKSIRFYLPEALRVYLEEQGIYE